jgi:hypothetical protein
MAKAAPSKDFRTTRTLLPDEVFLLDNGPRPGPTDLVSKDVWHGIMRLPDDVAITTPCRRLNQERRMSDERDDGRRIVQSRWRARRLVNARLAAVGAGAASNVTEARSTAGQASPPV